MINFFKQLFCFHIDKPIESEKIGNEYRLTRSYALASYSKRCVTYKCLKCGRIKLKKEYFRT